ncbi:MAG: type II secretion system secretin GspD [Endozoicomonadaceae bacterium]|nr:type II secretion system secretin GspD [Endozoicomonadaceae bacterium]
MIIFQTERASIKSFTALTLSLLITGLPMLALAEQPPQVSNTIHKSTNITPSEKRWTLNQQNTDIREFIAQIATITGDTFVIDPKTKAGNTVSVISSTPMNREQIYDIFLEVLSTNGYAVVPKGNVKNIIPNTLAKTAGTAPSAVVRPDNATMVTRVLDLHSISAIEVIPIIRPLVAQYGHAAASSSGNVVVISDLADNANRVIQIIKDLDDASDNDYEVIKLQHAWVGDISNIIQETLSNNKMPIPSGVQVIADERSNRLIIKGNASKRARIRKLVHTLDEEGIQTSSTRVMFLRYADAKNLAEILSEASQSLSAGNSNSKANSNNSSRLPTTPHPPSMRQGTHPNTKSNKKGLTGSIFIKADETTNALVMIADPNTLKELESLVRQLDIRRAQVLIEAAIVEVSGDIGDALGIQWGIAGKNTYNNKTPNPVSVIGAPLPSIKIGSLALRNSNFGILVNALSNRTKTNLLSTPSMLTLDNEEAEFVVGQEVPFQTGSYTSGGDSHTNPFTTTERKPVGLTLKVTPHIGEGESLRIEIEQEISNLLDNTTSMTQSGDPITSQRKIKATILVDDGNTVILGGLLQDDSQKGTSKVPFLGDIPFLGELFTNRNNKRTKKNLMLFIKPTIMRTPESLTNMTKHKYSTLKLIHDGKATLSVNGEMPDTAAQLFELRMKKE